MNDTVNHPQHYTEHPSGIECIEISEQLNFNLGNALKYLFRHGKKHKGTIVDLEKALWYVRREISRVPNPERNFLGVGKIREVAKYESYAIGAAMVAIVQNNLTYAEELIQFEVSKHATP